MIPSAGANLRTKNREFKNEYMALKGEVSAMDMFKRRKVEISDEDRAKSYAKYYDREPERIPPAMMGKVFGPPMPADKALPFTERNSILDDDGKTADTGYIVMPDGTSYITLVTEIPGATPEMIDWWFAWRGLDALQVGS